MERAHKPTALSTAAATPAPAGGIADTSSHKDRVTLSLPSGETAEILYYGATVISWKNAAGQEQLFLSDKAVLDGSKPVRGGIPLVFPLFGPSSPSHPATAALPQHGFARTAVWKFLDKTEADAPAALAVNFGLSHNEIDAAAQAAWPHEFTLTYTVALAPGSLECKMEVRNAALAADENEGEEGGRKDEEKAWEFNVLFHTYLRVQDSGAVAVRGLTGVEYRDKTLGGATATESADAVTIADETDSMYTNVPGPVSVEQDGKPVFSVERTGLPDVVLWNPGASAAAKMGDFGPTDGHKHMVCVEAGAVGAWKKLMPEESWEGRVVISSKI